MENEKISITYRGSLLIEMDKNGTLVDLSARGIEKISDINGLEQLIRCNVCSPRGHCGDPPLVWSLSYAGTGGEKLKSLGDHPMAYGMSPGWPPASPDPCTTNTCRSRTGEPRRGPQKIIRRGS